MKLTISLLYLIPLISGCASHIDLTKSETSIQSFAIETYRWMHVQATTLNNQFQLCGEDCPKRTPKTLPMISVNTELHSASDLQSPSIQVINTPKHIDIYFSSSSFALDAAARKKLSQTVAMLNHDLSIRSIMIRGRTDDLGTQSLNDKLAVSRGLAIRNYMRDNGLRSDIHMTVKGKGRCCYVADNGTEEGRRHNRRVELLFDGDRSA